MTKKGKRTALFQCRERIAELERANEALRAAMVHASEGAGALRMDDRENTELALKASEEKYRLLIEKTNDVIWTAGLDLVLTYVSPSVERALGFTPEEHLKRPLSEQLTPDSLARAHDALQKHIESERIGQADPEQALRIELEYYRRDGSTVWMEQHVSGLRDARGALTGICGVARGISGQEERARAASKMARDGIYSGTQEGVTIRTGTRDGRTIWITGSASGFEYEGRSSMLVCAVDTTAIREMEDRAP